MPAADFLKLAREFLSEPGLKVTDNLPGWKDAQGFHCRLDEAKEREFLEKLKAIEGINRVETQEFTMEKF